METTSVVPPPGTETAWLFVVRQRASATVSAVAQSLRIYGLGDAVLFGRLELSSRGDSNDVVVFVTGLDVAQAGDVAAFLSEAFSQDIRPRRSETGIIGPLRKGLQRAEARSKDGINQRALRSEKRHA